MVLMIFQCTLLVLADWDGLVNVCQIPRGPCTATVNETGIIFSCDISYDDKYIVTGSYSDNKATVYENILAQE